MNSTLHSFLPLESVIRRPLYIYIYDASAREIRSRVLLFSGIKGTFISVLARIITSRVVRTYIRLNIVTFSMDSRFLQNIQQTLTI